MTYSVTLLACCVRGGPGQTRLSRVFRRRSLFATHSLMAISRQPFCTVGEQNGLSDDAQFSLKLGTFNLLAPCYKTIKSRERRAWWGGRKESSNPELFLARYEEVFKIFEGLPPFDFLCLQEFWFQNDIAELFEKRIGDRYTIYKHKRPTRNDGVALLVTRQFRVRDVEYIKFNDIGMRVALMVHVENLSTGQEVIIVTTHLTYLASYLDQFTRMAQAKKLGQAIDQYITSLDKKDIPLLLCGDFNGGPEGPIYKYFTDLGFISAYKSFHGNEPVVTHFDHKGSLMSVDYVFYRMPDELECTVVDAFLVPKDRSDKEWPTDFLASDHRLVYAEIVVSPKRT